MLNHLEVRNYALIDNLDIDFSEGFTAITGETGAGKTIMAGALSLLLGSRADRESVREGAESVDVVGVFTVKGEEVLSWLSEHGIESDEGEIIIRRSVRPEKNSIYTCNGVRITRKEGEELSSLLVDIASQNMSSYIRNPINRLAILDRHITDLVDEYGKAYSEMRDVEKRLEEVRKNALKNEEEREFMRYTVGEIDSANLSAGEEERTVERLSVIGASEFLNERLSSAASSAKNAYSLLLSALEDVRKASAKKQSLTKHMDRIESLAIEAEDMANALRDELSEIEFSENELEALNERLSVIQRIKRRFGGSVEEALRRRDEYSEILNGREATEDLITDLENEIKEKKSIVLKIGAAITDERKKAAQSLSERTENILRRLNMEAVSFRIDVLPLSEPGPYGLDETRFMIAPNKGEGYNRVEDIASGGEMSRIILAIKASSCDSLGPETMLFDEIDTGTGGLTAASIGEVLRNISKNVQVIAITHLAQISTRASAQYVVRKEEIGGRTHSVVNPVEGEARVEETARMLSGEINDKSMAHARSLLEVQALSE